MSTQEKLQAIEAKLELAKTRTTSNRTTHMTDEVKEYFVQRYFDDNEKISVITKELQENGMAPAIKMQNLHSYKKRYIIELEKEAAKLRDEL